MDTSKVTRVEVINHAKGGNGREYVTHHNNIQVNIELQDDERTLKIFIANKKEWNPEIKPEACPNDGSCEACQ